MAVDSRDEELSKLREENKRLKKKLQKKDERILRYEKDLAKNSVIERWKIGKYLHDNLAQQLTSAKISISLLKNELSKEDLSEQCDKVLDIIDESVTDVRDLSHDIIPIEVEKEGVRQAFNYLKNRAERQHGVNVILETGEIIDKVNDRAVATNLYHIVQEAIKNAIVHGKAQNIKIALSQQEQQLYLYIKDDGQGFDANNGDSGMGITIMQHRTKEIGGECNIKDIDEDDYTTCVTCILPLKSLTGEYN